MGLTSTKASHAFHTLLSLQKLLGITDGTALGGSILLLQRGRLRLRESGFRTPSSWLPSPGLFSQ